MISDIVLGIGVLVIAGLILSFVTRTFGARMLPLHPRVTVILMFTILVWFVGVYMLALNAGALVLSWLVLFVMTARGA